MHGLLRSYAVELCDGAAGDDIDDTTAALLRLLDHYGHAASLAMDTLYPAERYRRPEMPAPGGVGAPALSEPAVARAWLEAERANLLGAVAFAEARGWTGRTGRLAATLWRELDLRGHDAEAPAVHRLALSAAEAAGDRSAEATALLNLSYADRNLARYADCLVHARR